MPSPLDLGRLLTVLEEAGVEFVIVGGIAAIAHGATTPTGDLDLVVPMTAQTLDGVLHALAPYHPRHATRPDLSLGAGDADALSRFRFLLIETDLGRLDLLRRVEPAGEFEALRFVDLELIPGRTFRVLALDQLIETKARLGRPKDRVVEAELRAIEDASRGRP